MRVLFTPEIMALKPLHSRGQGMPPPSVLCKITRFLQVKIPALPFLAEGRRWSLLTVMYDALQPVDNRIQRSIVPRTDLMQRKHDWLNLSWHQLQQPQFNLLKRRGKWMHLASCLGLTYTMVLTKCQRFMTQ